jgi:hypothetical protein
VAITCTASSGRPAAARPCWTQAAIAAQDRRVTRLEAQARRIRRHVRPRFVDDADDTQRHAHAADLDAARPVAKVGHLADRIGQRRDLLQPVRHRGDGLGGQLQPIDERRVVAGGFRRRHVRRIRREEPGFVAQDRVGHREQRGVLGIGVGACDFPSRDARGFAYLPHVGGDIGNLGQSRDVEVRHRDILARRRQAGGRRSS